MDYFLPVEYVLFVTSWGHLSFLKVQRKSPTYGCVDNSSESPSSRLTGLKPNLFGWTVKRKKTTRPVVTLGYSMCRLAIGYEWWEVFLVSFSTSSVGSLRQVLSSCKGSSNFSSPFSSDCLFSSFALGFYVSTLLGLIISYTLPSKYWSWNGLTYFYSLKSGTEIFQMLEYLFSWFWYLLLYCYLLNTLSSLLQSMYPSTHPPINR